MEINLIRFLPTLCTLTSLVASSSLSRNDTTTSEKLLRNSIKAPSWEFHGIDHRWTWKPKYNNAEYEALSVFVNQFEGSHEFAKNQLVLMFGRDSVIESRLKPIASIAEELDDDGNRTVKDIYDVVTWRVTFPTVQQLLKAKYRFINDSRFTVAIVKCFGVCPRAGRRAATGYRGITLMAEVDGKPTEIQLVTPYMVMWADWAYSVLLEKSMSSRQEIVDYALDLSDYFYHLDVERNKLPDCPSALLHTDMRTLTTAGKKKDKIFEALGSPPSACQFWNDLAVNKNANIGARRSALGFVDAGKKNTGNKPGVIDIDKILKPGDVESFGETKRSLESPVYHYY